VDEAGFGGYKLSLLRQRGFRGELEELWTRIKLYRRFVLVMKVTMATHPNFNGSVDSGFRVYPIRWSYGETGGRIKAYGPPDRFVGAKKSGRFGKREELRKALGRDTFVDLTKFGTRRITATGCAGRTRRTIDFIKRYPAGLRIMDVTGPATGHRREMVNASHGRASARRQLRDGGGKIFVLGADRTGGNCRSSFGGLARGPGRLRRCSQGGNEMTANSPDAERAERFLRWANVALTATRSACT